MGALLIEEAAMPWIAYKITNQVNGKEYIGITTTSLQQRWMEHVRNADQTRLLQRAIRKHGRRAFGVAHVASAVDRPALMALESLLIEQDGTLAPAGYNLTTGGEHPQIASEVRARLSKKALARMADPATKAVLAASARKWLAQPGAKERVGDAVRASKANPKTKALHAKIAQERWDDPDYRARVTASICKQWKTAERRRQAHAEHMRLLNKTMAAELAAASRERWADPEYRERLSEKIREARRTPESRARAAERARVQWANPEVRARMVRAARARKPKASPS